MLPVILGAVALGAVGYGVKKLLEDDDFRDKLEDTVMDLGYGVDRFEEKFGLDGFTISKDEDPQGYETMKKFFYATKTKENESELKSLYKEKKELVIELDEKHSINICELDEIKKDKIKDMFEDTQQIYKNAKEYKELLKSFHKKIDDTIEENSNANISKYTDILKEICTTKIIKKGKFNKNSTLLIEKAKKVLDATQEKIDKEEVVLESSNDVNHKIQAQE